MVKEPLGVEVSLVNCFFFTRIGEQLDPFYDRLELGSLGNSFSALEVVNLPPL